MRMFIISLAVIYAIGAVYAQSIMTGSERCFTNIPEEGVDAPSASALQLPSWIAAHPGDGAPALSSAAKPIESRAAGGESPMRAMPTSYGERTLRKPC